MVKPSNWVNIFEYLSYVFTDLDQKRPLNLRTKIGNSGHGWLSGWAYIDCQTKREMRGSCLIQHVM